MKKRAVVGLAAAVCAAVTANANGEDKYRVYKSDGRIEFIGSGSSWVADDAEHFM